MTGVERQEEEVGNRFSYGGDQRGVITVRLLLWVRCVRMRYESCVCVSEQCVRTSAGRRDSRRQCDVADARLFDCQKSPLDAGVHSSLCVPRTRYCPTRSMHSALRCGHPLRLSVSLR